MSARYWLLPPGSTDPPEGPFSIDELQAAWQAGSVTAQSTVCAVDDTVWRDVSSVFEDQEPPPQSEPPPKPSRSATEVTTTQSKRASTTSKPQGQSVRRLERRWQPDDHLEERYKNLENVATSTKAYGSLLKALGASLAVAGLFWALLLVFLESLWLASVGVAAIPFGILLHVTGTMIAAMGEAFLALRDIATNSWGSTRGRDGEKS